ncbi:MAG TPA: PD-(D/E)XK nuclease family protein [Puia sp.]
MEQQKRIDKDIFLILRKLIDSFPPVRGQRRSIFDIAGYPNWENVVSNMLAFYLTEDEQHGFGRVVFNCLPRIIRKKGVEVIEDFENESFFVQREKDNIDILIQSSIKQKDINNWAILIENKIKADLYNDLGKYWNSINARVKIGIILSLQPISEAAIRKFHENGIMFYNISHKEICSEIKASLFELYDVCDDRHLLYLKDFIHNIESHYPNSNMEKELSLKLEAFQANADTIDKLKELEIQLNNFVGSSIGSGISNFAFYPTGSMNVQSKHYYYNPNYSLNSTDAPKHALCKEFRFYVYQVDLFRYGTLTIYFELFNEAVKFTSSLKKVLEKNDLFSMGPELKESNNGGPQYSYSHIAALNEIDIRPDIRLKGLDIAVKDILNRNFFQGEKGFVQRCAELLEDVKNIHLNES